MATITTIKTTKRWHWRTIAYSILAGLYALQSLIVGLVGIAPYPWQPPDPATPWITKWHSAHSAMVVGVLTGILLLVTLWRPKNKAGLLQVFVVVSILFGPVTMLLRSPYFGFDMSNWVFYAILAIMILLSPAREQLFSLKGEGSTSKPLLFLTVAAGLLFLPDLWQNLQLQIAGFQPDQAQRYFWLGAIFFFLVLIGIGFLTAIKRPGWQVLGILLGIVYLYLGIVAISIPNEVGSWGTVGGILSILGGVTYLVLTVWEMRRTAPANPVVIR
jgi:hypothetical protein